MPSFTIWQSIVSILRQGLTLVRTLHLFSTTLAVVTLVLLFLSSCNAAASGRLDHYREIIPQIETSIFYPNGELSTNDLQGSFNCENVSPVIIPKTSPAPQNVAAVKAYVFFYEDIPTTSFLNGVRSSEDIEKTCDTRLIIRIDTSAGRGLQGEYLLASSADVSLVLVEIAEEVLNAKLTGTITFELKTNNDSPLDSRDPNDEKWFMTIELTHTPTERIYSLPRQLFLPAP